jgi:hypothetical protein
MRRIVGRMTAVGLMVLWCAEVATADLVFSVDAVSLSDGTKLTGTFTTNDAITKLTGADIIAPKAGAFPGFEYTLGNSTTPFTLTGSSTGNNDYIRLDSGGNEFQLSFSSLTASGGTLQQNSYDHEPAGGNRTATGTVSPVSPQATVAPEPSTVALALTAVPAGLIIWLRRRKRAA